MNSSNSRSSRRQAGSAALIDGSAAAERVSTVPAAAQASAFAALDDIAQHPGCHGIVRLHAESTAFASLGRHLGRRARQLGRAALIACAPAADAWQQLARRVGALDEDNTDALHVALRLADDTRGMMLVVAEHRQTNWGRALRDELVRLARETDRGLLLVVLTPAAKDARASSQRSAGLSNLVDAPATLSSASVASASVGASSAVAEAAGFDPASAEDTPLELELSLDELDAADRRRWWSALVAQDGMLNQARFRELDSLDAWWEATRRQPSGHSRLPLPKGAAGKLLGYLHAAEQALTPAQIAELGAGDAIDAIIEQGAARRDFSGALVVTAEHETKALSRSARNRLAEVLASCEADAWSMLRAAELLAGAPEDAARAEQLAFKALRHSGDTTARQDLWRRWDNLLALLASHPGSDDEDRLGRLLRSGELALELGDGERADMLARQAMTIDGDRFAVLLLHGRSSNARGDVTTAALSLSRAMSHASGTGERARASGLMAQVRYMAGDPKQAERFANQAIELAEDVATRLEGRNVLGKLLLAREDWADAEQHFAADAYDAAVAGEREIELRARLNRAISILYLGRREKARDMLESVMKDGTRYGVHRAVAFTLSNLAAIAILEHQYERALALSEQAIEVRRVIGGRIGMVQPITNLAELRLQLGLVDEAEQALRFGLQACGHDLPLSRYAFFAKASACIHLERGQTGPAAKDVATAISGATCSGELSVLAQCHRINARIALEDGDLARAHAALDHARQMRHTAFGQAELAVLAANCKRAAGDDFLDEAREALRQAERADDPESRRDAYLLLYHAHRLGGDDDAARSHLRSAIGERDRVTSGLPASLRKRYLDRKALSELAALETATQDDVLPPLLPLVADGPTTERTPSMPRKAKRAGERRIVGQSSAMRTLRGTIGRVAATDASVLITGPTGAGKELVAEAIHRGSPRRNGPLVKVNCAALVETLLLSELFGHEKGAFTGASARRRGRFEVAEGGTLFLDEIGDISPRTQVALLRVLQDGTFERVGGCSQLRANVRIVCATHRDLKEMVEQGQFRQNLYYRLCGMIIEVPALRERAADIAQLAEAILGRAQRTSGIVARPLSRGAVRGLSRHGWPGNVRELENALRVAALFARGDEIELSDFTENVEGLRHLADRDSQPGSIPPPSDPALSSRPRASERIGDSLPPPSNSTDLVYAEVRGGTGLADMKRRLEQECIARALVESGGNITRAAALLGMKRPRLSQLVKQYKLASVLEDIKS